jgi:serine protease Do
MNEFNESKDLARSTARRATGRRVLVGALLASTIVATGFGVSAWSAETPALEGATTQPLSNQEGFAALAEKVKPAVVNIATTEKPKKMKIEQMPEMSPDSPMGQMFQQFFGHGQMQQDNGPMHALGSGFIVDADGTIVTNNHVIDGATKITVTLDDGTSYPATVKGRDEKTDLAVLKIDAKKPLPYLAFGDSDKAKIGNWVIAVGNPYGLGGTVTAGIVSAHGRDIKEGPYDNFLQIDAPINPGNSGGPLFNQEGQVIGIDTAIFTPSGGSVGIGFAIPSDLAKSVVAQLREHGDVARGWLGVQMQPLTDTLAKAMGRSSTDGVLVDKVQADSPAKTAGLMQGDLITAYNGKIIKDPRDISMAVADTAAGSSATISYIRNGVAKTVDVTIAKLKDDAVAANDKSEEGPIGLALAQLSPENRDQFGIDASVKGVVVERVAPDSHAADSGVKAGDVIVKIGDDAVTSPAEAAKTLQTAEKEKKEAVPVLVVRDGNTYYLALQLANG